MEKILFTNPDTKKNFELPLDRNMIFIYGGNGSGKTTLSRSFQTENYMVFNTDFVNRNVYIVKSTGADVDGDTKENFSSLFLGEEAVDLAKDVEKLNAKKKELDKQNKSLFSEYKEKVQAIGLIPFKSMSEVLEKIDYEFVFDSKSDYETNKKKFKLSKLLATTVSDENEFMESMRIYKENHTVQNLNKDIEKSPNLTCLIVDKANVIDVKQIEKYNCIVDDIKVLEQSFNLGQKPSETKSWIKQGVLIHEELADCIFCGNKDIKSKIDEWKEKLDNELLKEKDELVKHLKDVKNDLDIILRNRALYKDIIPKIISTLSSVNGIIDSYLSGIAENKSLTIAEYLIDIDPIQKEAQDRNSDLLNYFTNKELNELVFSHVYQLEIESFLKKQIEDSEKLNLIYANDTAKSINEISKILGFTKDIKVDIEKRGNMPKIALQSQSKTTKISQYSEGQRHKLALAVFFSKCIKSKVLFEAIVLDDPVITLDVKAYHALKGMLKDKRFQKAKRLIITTHNIHYLYVQISNILEDEELKKYTKLYEITPDTFNDIPLDLLKSDDVSLYSNYIKSMTSYDQLGYIYWLTSKIARYFLDLRLRINGIMSAQNMSLEIDLLDLEESEKDDLQHNFNVLSETCKKKSLTVKSIIDTFTSLNQILKILEFPQLVTQSTIKQFAEHENELIAISDKCINVYEEILVYGRSIHFYEGSDAVLHEMKNYISHPRNQITESMLVLKASKDI
jgi:energy-coupling factor transporter ATP-binding protein EcfA2